MSRPRLSSTTVVPPPACLILRVRVLSRCVGGSCRLGYRGGPVLRSYLGRTARGGGVQWIRPTSHLPVRRGQVLVVVRDSGSDGDGFSRCTQYVRGGTLLRVSWRHSLPGRGARSSRPFRSGVPCLQTPVPRPHRPDGKLPRDPTRVPSPSFGPGPFRQLGSPRPRPSFYWVRRR